MRVANFEDVKYLSKNLRKCDEEELKAFANLSPQSALTQGLIFSELPIVVVNNNKPVAMFGVVPEGDLGLIWFLGTDELKDLLFLIVLFTASSVLVSEGTTCLVTAPY